MRNVERLLDRAREMCVPPTDYALAKRLGVHKQSISRVRRQGGNLDNYAAFQLAKLLNMDAATVVSYLEEDRAPMRRKEFWRSQLPRLLAAAGLAASLTVYQPRDSEAAQGVKGVGDTLYIMRTLKRLLAALRAARSPRAAAAA